MSNRVADIVLDLIYQKSEGDSAFALMMRLSNYVKVAKVMERTKLATDLFWGFSLQS